MVAVALSVHFQAVNAIGAFFCNDINWKNDCVHWTNLYPGACYTLDAAHQDKVSSFGPDEVDECLLYPDFDCMSVEQGYLKYPGSGDLRTEYYPAGEPMNDHANSFRCWAASN
ncbi:hypothetical protein FB451DRAFT_1443900 [Mycena latifolia]|nr:hypothetical protein FB451DRAFT_1443900 [Mycena latifolia]